MSLILTQAGLAALAEAESTGTKVQATHMAVGDGGGATPEHTGASLALVNEKWRGALQSIIINEQGETEAGKQVVFEVHVPMDVGGWYIRECALYADDVLLAIGPHPTLYKPAPEDPTKMEHIIKAPITFGNADVVSLIVDPAVVLGSQEFVANSVAAHDANDASHADIRAAVASMTQASDTHTGQRDNPHQVTAEQVGAAEAAHSHEALFHQGAERMRATADGVAVSRLDFDPSVGIPDQSGLGEIYWMQKYGGADIAAGNAVSKSGTVGACYVQRANDTSVTNFVGVALAAAVDYEWFPVLVSGLVRFDSLYNFSSSPNIVWLGTSGTLHTTTPSISGRCAIKAGYAASAGSFYVQPNSTVCRLK